MDDLSSLVLPIASAVEEHLHIQVFDIKSGKKKTKYHDPRVFLSLYHSNTIIP